MAIHLDPATTALVLIDLENGILAMPVQPHAADLVLRNGAKLAAAFRDKGAKVIYVRVDLANMQPVKADVSHASPGAPPPPAEASEISTQAGMRDADLLVTKHHWSAFGRTELKEVLERADVKTIVFGGLVTNLGVESSARHAVAEGFDVVLAQDACSALSADAHQFVFTNVFPLLGRVGDTEAIIDGLT